jgi:hypothetical protein
MRSGPLSSRSTPCCHQNVRAFQRLDSFATLKLAQRAFQQNDKEAEPLVGEALQHAEQGNAELYELAHRILPSALTRRGLQAGVDAVVERLDLPVQVDVPASGSRRRSRQARTSSWPRRSPTS